MGRFRSGKRGASVALGAALVALAAGVSVGLAKSGPTQVTVPLPYHNESCGAVSTKKSIGTATVIAEKGVLTVRGKIRGGDPGKSFLELWTGDGTCTMIATLDTFKVDAGGSGNFAGSIAISGQQQFFVSVFNPAVNFSNDSPIFTVGGL